MDAGKRLIARWQSFLLRAPRQPDKTFGLLTLMELLRWEGRYRAVHATLEMAHTAREDVPRTIRTICEGIDCKV